MESRQWLPELSEKMWTAERGLGFIETTRRSRTSFHHVSKKKKETKKKPNCKHACIAPVRHQKLSG